MNGVASYTADQDSVRMILLMPYNHGRAYTLAHKGIEMHLTSGSEVPIAWSRAA